MVGSGRGKYEGQDGKNMRVRRGKIRGSGGGKYDGREEENMRVGRGKI